MGTSTSSTQAQQTFYSNLQYIKSLDISKSLMRDPKTNQYFIIVQHTFPSQQQMHKFSQQLRRCKQFYHQYYMGPIKQLVVSSNNLCSKQHKVVQIFKYEQYTLLDQIRNRKQQNRVFSEREIWSILCSCVLAMSQLTKNDITHITLHPQDIVLTNEGQVKLLASQLSQYQFDYTYKHGFYYAPETLKAITNRSVYSINNKAGVWSLGLTILSVMHVQDMVCMYRQNVGGGIDYAAINDMVDCIENVQIKGVLSKMLKQMPYERICFTELQEMLYGILERNNMDTQHEHINTQMEMGNKQDNQNTDTYRDSKDRDRDSRDSKDRDRDRDRDRDGQQHQIQKLQQSIYRLNTKLQHNAHSSSTNNITSRNTHPSMTASVPDGQDQPNTLDIAHLVDIQIMDQQDNAHNRLRDRDRDRDRDREISKQAQRQRKNTDNSNTNSRNINNNNNSITLTQHHITHKWSDAHIKGPLADKSNCIDISQSLKIVDDNKMFDYFSGVASTKANKDTGPYYVTEQYNRGRYEGYKQSNMRHGFGTFYYEEGGKYCGEWCKNKMEGRGALYYTNGELAYEGEWSQDQLNGYGVLYNESPVYITSSIDWKNLDRVSSCWVKYEGNFAKDSKQGEGTLYLSNGEYFRGDFQEDLPHGKGIYRALNGQLVKGKWKAGIFQNYQQ